MTTKLDEQTIEIVKATAPILEQYGDTITTRFYELMLRNEPQLNDVFNQTHQRVGEQPKALANTIYAAAANIDNLESILPVVKQIAQKHKSLSIQPEQYPIVGKYLLLAMKDVLKDAATDDIIDAWAKAYSVIADVFILVEKELYEADKTTRGGWNGFRDFKVVKKHPETKYVTSFYLAPVDKKPLMKHTPGQYITIKAEIPGERYTHLRQYSISCAPGSDMYRISVKRETGFDDHPDGIVSTYLHDQVEEDDVLQFSAPAGDFNLNTNDTRPLVLISRGVGLTPMMSMLECVIAIQPNREVHFIHATYSSNYHAMKDRMKEIAENNPQVKLYSVYNKPLSEDEGGYDYKGYVDETLLKEVLPSNDLPCYLCGPHPFMTTVAKALKAYDVKNEDIHYEVFGSQLAQSIS